MIKNKKGQIGGIIGDLFIGFFIVFVFILILGFTYTIWVQYNANIQLLPESIADSSTKAEINSWTSNFLLLDKLVILMFIMFWAGAIAASLLTTPEHPFFFLVSLISLFIVTIFVIIMVDFGTEIFDNIVLFTFTSQLTNSYFFIHNMHYISFFVMLFSSVWFFGRGNFSVRRGIE